MTIKVKKCGNPSEDAIQCDVMEWVNHHPSMRPYVIHIPNQGKRSVVYGRQLKRMGMRPGVSDIFIACPVGDYPGAWIEIKSEGGRPTKEQVEFQEIMSSVGYFCKITWGFDETILAIGDYFEGNC